MIMNNTHKEVSMGFTHKTFPVGSHMCLIYSDDRERREVISKYLESGLLTGEKVAYFADMMTPHEVKDWLVNIGLELPQGDKTEQFSVTIAENTYCPKGKFVPNEMLDTLRSFYRQTIDESYPGCRVSGEMSWALKNIPGSDRLMEYEALVNGVLATHPVTAVCQYDANRFDGATILDVLKVHPMMIVRNQIVNNPYYLKPKEFLKDYTGGK
jgi:DcmR-like sensory protein